MTSRLFVREVGQREFTKQNGDFETADIAKAAGEDLCRSGNVAAFEVWTRDCAFERQWTLRATDGVVV